MNREIEELLSKIIKDIEKVTKLSVPEDIINKIRTKLYFLETLPEIKITSEPTDFDSSAREKNASYQSPSGKSYRERIHTDVLHGDYKPGLSKIKDCSDNQKFYLETHSMSDFSMNKLQIVLSNNYDENQYILVIYIPEEKYRKENSFKKFIENEQKQTLLKQLHEKTRGKVPETELLLLVDKFDFSNGIPTIKVISDPTQFDKTVKKTSVTYSNSGEYESGLDVDVNTLYGNYQSGNVTVFEHRGSLSSSSETHTPSDFDLNNVQIVFVSNFQYRRFYMDSREKEESSIVIYLPEKEYEEKSYKEYADKQKRTRTISDVKQLCKSYIGFYPRKWKFVT